MTIPALLSALELACLGRVPRAPRRQDIWSSDAPEPEDCDTCRPDSKFRASGLRRHTRRACTLSPQLTPDG